MKVLITGANGFIGKNLCVHLRERGIESVSFVRGMTQADLAAKLEGVEFIFHLAGVNRPKDESEFIIGNTSLTQSLCELIRESGRKIPILYTSSIQAEIDNPYGQSKREAEEALLQLEKAAGIPVYIYRLPNVFGKWSRPNYNSVVATFCHNIANDLPIHINFPDAILTLVYIDDVVREFMRLLEDRPLGVVWPEITPQYEITVGELAAQIKAFKDSRNSMIIEEVGQGVTRALYSTYLSYLRPAQFTYPLRSHVDVRGQFVEFLKTKNVGQFSFFTAHSGVTRGGHYHHSKNEKFLVVQGRAKFKFRHIETGESYEILTDAATPEVVETVPGWSHDITNIGNGEMIVLLWANEIFDPQYPDTITYKV